QVGRRHCRHRHLAHRGPLVRADVSELGLLSAALVRDPNGTLLHAVVHIQDITARKQAKALPSFRATHDALTGRPNRSLSMDRLAVALVRLARTTSTASGAEHAPEELLLRPTSRCTRPRIVAGPEPSSIGPRWCTGIDAPRDRAG